MAGALCGKLILIAYSCHSVPYCFFFFLFNHTHVYMIFSVGTLVYVPPSNYSNIIQYIIHYLQQCSPALG